MGGGRDKNGSPIYKRVNGIYVRLDGKPVKHRNQKKIDEIITIKSNSVISSTARAAATPLPKTGKEVGGFLKNMMALDNLNDRTSGNSISANKRKDSQLYQKLIDGRIDTPNGGFIFQENRDKNNAYIKYNDMPGFDDIMNQVIPQLKPENLREVKTDNIPASTIDGKTVNNKMWIYETFVNNNQGQPVRTYVKIFPFHSNSGKPYAILVSLHRTGRMADHATQAQRG